MFVEFVETQSLLNCDLIREVIQQKNLFLFEFCPKGLVFLDAFIYLYEKVQGKSLKVLGKF